MFNFTILDSMFVRENNTHLVWEDYFKIDVCVNRDFNDPVEVCETGDKINFGS